MFPAIDIPKSGTRREDLLLNKEEQDAVYIIRKAMNGMKADEAVDNLLNMFSRTRTNAELVQTVIRPKIYLKSLLYERKYLILTHKTDIIFWLVSCKM